jgi:transposase
MLDNGSRVFFVDVRLSHHRDAIETIRNNNALGVRLPSYIVVLVRD